VLNNLKGETSEFIEKYKVGLNFDYEKNLLQDKLLILINDKNLMMQMKQNSVHVAKNILDKKHIYQELIEHLEN
jgi:hypothetical protein